MGSRRAGSQARSPPLAGRAHFRSPEDAGAPPRVCLQALAHPASGAEAAPHSARPGHCPLHAQRASRLCGLGYRPSNHSGSLGLPTSVQNKVLRLLMIKMCPVPCPSAVASQGGQRGSDPLSLWAEGAQPPLVPLGLRPLPTPAVLGRRWWGGSRGGLRCKEYNKQNHINTIGKSLTRKHVAYGTFLLI